MMAIEHRRAQLQRKARAILPYLRRMAERAEMIDVEVNRTNVMDWLEAIKDHLMPEVEAAYNRGELSYDEAIQYGNLVSGIAKSWSRIPSFLEDSQVRRFVGAMLVMLEEFRHITDTLGFRILEEGELLVLRPGTHADE